MRFLIACSVPVLILELSIAVVARNPSTVRVVIAVAGLAAGSAGVALAATYTGFASSPASVATGLVVFVIGCQWMVVLKKRSRHRADVSSTLVKEKK